MPNRDVILLLKFTLLEFKQFNKIYFALLFVHLVILFTEPTHFLIAVTKPTLLISLIAFYMQKGFKTLLYPQKLFLFGLFFSLLGDVLLIGEDYFIFGLGAFLIAQLAYTFAFYRSNYGQKGLIQKKPIVAAVVFRGNKLFLLLSSVITVVQYDLNLKFSITMKFYHDIRNMF